MEKIEARDRFIWRKRGSVRAQVDLDALPSTGQLQPQELTVAEKIALGEGDVADHAFRGRVAGTEQLAVDCSVTSTSSTTRSWAARDST